MIITGSAIMVRPGTSNLVEQKLRAFPEVTFHGKSASGTELVVNFECEDQDELGVLCFNIRDSVPEIIDIGHIYINFEEEIEKMMASC